MSAPKKKQKLVLKRRRPIKEEIKAITFTLRFNKMDCCGIFRGSDYKEENGEYICDDCETRMLCLECDELTDTNGGICYEKNDFFCKDHI